MVKLVQRFRCNAQTVGLQRCNFQEVDDARKSAKIYKPFQIGCVGFALGSITFGAVGFWARVCAFGSFDFPALLIFIV